MPAASSGIERDPSRAVHSEGHGNAVISPCWRSAFPGPIPDVFAPEHGKPGGGSPTRDTRGTADRGTRKSPLLVSSTGGEDDRHGGVRPVQQPLPPTTSDMITIYGWGTSHNLAHVSADAARDRPRRPAHLVDEQAMPLSVGARGKGDGHAGHRVARVVEYSHGDGDEAGGDLAVLDGVTAA